MKIQEALIEAMNRPIKDLSDIMLEREDSNGSNMIFTVSAERLQIRDWESEEDSTHAKLYLEDILADDWQVISIRERDKKLKESK